MPKVNIECNLPEEEEELETYMKASDFKMALTSIRDELRHQVKYNHDLSEEKREALEWAYSEFWEACRRWEVDGML